MAQPPNATVLDHFSDLDDPRVERTRRHKLVDIIAIAICATICGADSWVHVELFGKSKLEWFQTFLELPSGIPSHDTFGDVFARLDPTQFQNCFVSWTQAVAELLPGEVVAPSLDQSPQNGPTIPRLVWRQEGYAPRIKYGAGSGQRLGDAAHPDPGPSQNCGEIQ